MYKLVILALLLVATHAGLVRIPKIYNALISSDENLSPSHTYPIIEPVLRTTALGVAFPPLLASPPIQKQPPITQTQTQGNADKKEEPTNTESSANAQKVEKDAVPQNKDEKIIPQLSYHDTLYPLAFDPYLSYAYGNDFLFPAFPYYEHPVFVDLNNFKGAEKLKEREEINPAVNFKKNPEIPDVPPPPLPVNREDRIENKE